MIQADYVILKVEAEKIFPSYAGLVGGVVDEQSGETFTHVAWYNADLTTVVSETDMDDRYLEPVGI